MMGSVGYPSTLFDAVIITPLGPAPTTSAVGNLEQLCFFDQTDKLGQELPGDDEEAAKEEVGVGTGTRVVPW
jgi:hypothetical protein